MNTDEKDELEYDDDEAIAYIQKQLPQALKDKLGDDDYYYLLDAIYDFYEKKGFLKDSQEEVYVDLDELCAFVVKAAKTERIPLTEEEISLFVDAEIAYSETLGAFE